MFILLLSISDSYPSIPPPFIQIHAQFDLETIKKRDLVIDLGNGIKTNAQLTLPVIGNGPYPGVLLILGSGAEDMNETAGFIHINKTIGEKQYPPTPFFDISIYLSERGFAVLKYDKRGIGENHTIIDATVWGNMTQNDLIKDADIALNVLIQQPEVNTNKISVLAHSEGTVIALRLAIDNHDKVKNIVLMGSLAQSVSSIVYFQQVNLLLKYTKEILDKNKDGLLSLKEASEDLVFQSMVGGSISIIFTKENVSSDDTNTNDEQTSQSLNPKFNQDNEIFISIENELRPALKKLAEKFLTPTPGKCVSLEGCQLWVRSFLESQVNLDIISNITKNTSILLLKGENDTQTPVEQAFLLEQKLTELDHPDHILITYPNLGHEFSPSSEWYYLL
ncbi:MAG: alpha/beta fold hydrolase [Nitrosopumilus sp.]|nr:alpha/beta fold hydrolase [Nitrosopumilus sp.]